MYRLVNDLALERLLYLRVQVTLPDIMLIDVPVRFAHPSLPLGRYYPILLETEAEHRELERYLDASRTAPIRPDLFDRRRSALVAPCITLAQYPPPLPGWPWLLLCHWPPSHTALTDDPDMFARGAYTIEAFETVETLSLTCGGLLAALSVRSKVEVHLVPPVTDVAGRA